jgi:hypothetical protein
MFWNLDVLGLDVLGLDVLILDVLGYHRKVHPLTLKFLKVLHLATLKFLVSSVKSPSAHQYKLKSIFNWIRKVFLFDFSLFLN